MTAATKPIRTGFCGLGNPVESHRRCPVDLLGHPCSCECHAPDPHIENAPAGARSGVAPAGKAQSPSARAAEAESGKPEPSGAQEMRPAAPDGHLITAPCVLYDLDEVAYHADPVPATHGRSLSFSGAKTLVTKSPAHFAYEREHPVYKDAYDFGSGAHLYVLGDGPEVVEVAADSWRSKAAREAREEARAEGKLALLADDHAKVKAMADVLRRHPVAGGLFAPGNGHPEVSLFWQDAASSVFCRGRVDWLRLTGRPLVVDYKTAVSADPDAFGSKAADFGYFMQDPWYRDGVAALGLADPADLAFVFVVQEKDPPYAVSVVQMDAEAVRVGRDYNRRALDLYAECQSADHWPAYTDAVASASLPGWFVHRHDIRSAS